MLYCIPVLDVLHVDGAVGENVVPCARRVTAPVGHGARPQIHQAHHLPVQAERVRLIGLNELEELAELDHCLKGLELCHAALNEGFVD